ncbi:MULTISPECIES: ATP-binding protein [Trichocoleus]|uniref:histidine kinase n=1 Tax=Trichocoleus desertorum GB2-A4 TaxID=2933944 RepID=A0ABV0J8Y5_9CYAN|nr:ATP-binding protein [Trichocoleus sp. FACHB-46]MBD1862438.1 PAS domain S-box protein [Trichocoleus sp. FACHB-46]
MGQILRALIVEDSEDDTELLVLELEQQGYDPIYERVDTAKAMQAALDRATWDVIICDYSMPQFSAPAALALLQSRGLDIPFIIVSGTIGEDIAVAAMKAGAHDYLIKGNLVRLVPAIARELREAQERQARRAAQQALRENEERFRSLIENALDLIVVLAIDGTIQYTSPSSKTLFGYEPEAIAATNIFKYLHPEDISHVRQTFQNVIAQPGVTATAEFRCHHQDGSWRLLEASGKHFVEPSGTTRIIVNARDSTERRQAEEMRKALETEKELSELRSRFYSMMSHEFRSPLTAIQMTAQLMRDHSQAFEVNKQKECFQRILNATKRLGHLVDDVLVIGKAESGKFQVAPVPLDLSAFCQELITEFQLTSGKEHQIVFSYEGDGSDVAIDEEILRHVLSNLLANAIKYSPANTKIQFELQQKRDVAIIQVQDQGMGIPPEDLPHLFEPFHRASNVDRIPGTGLGLAIAKKFTELQGGIITATSELGVGTNFIVTLPLQAQL